MPTSRVRRYRGRGGREASSGVETPGYLLELGFIGEVRGSIRRNSPVPNASLHTTDRVEVLNAPYLKLSELRWSSSFRVPPACRRAEAPHIRPARLRTQDWEDLIADLRNTYSGALAYVDPGLFTNSSEISNFWDSLDIIGIPYYFSGSARNDFPSVSEMVTKIGAATAKNLTLVTDRHDLPVISFETGAPNFDGVNYEFWRTENRVQDNQEIIDYIEAQFLTQIDLGPAFKGNYMWTLQPRSKVYPIDGMFLEQPLWKSLAFWFSD